MDLTVVSKNKYLWQKIRLSLPECHVDFSETLPVGFTGSVIFDSDTIKGDAPRGALTVSRHGGAALTRPFSEEELRLAVYGKGKRRLRLADADRCAILDGVQIRLTEVEFALLRVLYDREGGFVSRGEIIEKVWNNSVSESAVNVYVHYLREKFERGGERLIFSSRKEGYRLNDALLEVRY